MFGDDLWANLERLWWLLVVLALIGLGALVRWAWQMVASWL